MTRIGTLRPPRASRPLTGPPREAFAGRMEHAPFRSSSTVAALLLVAAVAPLIRDRYLYTTAGGTSASAYEPGAVGATLDAALAVGIDL